MPQNDMLKRYLDAGIAFTEMTRARAKTIIDDFVKAGEVSRDQAQERIDDLVERSRKNTEAMVDTVRREIAQQLGQLGLATKDDLQRLEQRLSGRGAAASKAPSAPAAKKATSAPKAAAPAKKAPAKKASGTKKAPGTKKA
jgi:polyhydroxyalkanoate synthesis regulator phasin